MSHQSHHIDISQVSLSGNKWIMQPHLSGDPELQWHPNHREEPLEEPLEAAAANCSSASFPISKSYPIECLGLVAHPAGDASAEACEQSCCDHPLAGPRACNAWQWGATDTNCSAGKSSACGCWLGPSCEQSGTQGYWTGAARAPPPPSQAKPVWLRTTFDLPTGFPATGLPLALDLGEDVVIERKGHLYVNGFDCGRFWYGTKHMTERFYQLPPDYLKAKDNVLMLFDEIAPGNSTQDMRVVAAA